MKRVITKVLLLIALHSFGYACEIRLFTYNILSDAFLEMKTYENALSEDLKWDYRKWRLIERIRKMKADILCLQEINKESFNFFNDVLSKENYMGTYAEDNSKFKHGIATFYNKDKLKREMTKSVLCEGSSMCGKKSVRSALMTRFQLPHGHYLNVLNTKIKWVPNSVQLNDHPGYRQLCFLKDHFILNDINNYWVVLGDFNFTPEHPVFKMILDWNFVDPHFKENPCTFYDKNNSKRIDYIFGSNILDVQPIAVKTIKDMSSIPSKTEPSDHLPLGVTIYFKDSMAKKDNQ